MKHLLVFFETGSVNQIDIKNDDQAGNWTCHWVYLLCLVANPRCAFEIYSVDDVAYT